MFIKNIIIKELNTLYYKYFQETALFPLENDLDLPNLQMVINTLKIKDSNFDYYKNLIDDLHNANNNNFEFITSLAKDAFKIKFLGENKVRRSLQYNKVLLEVIDILKSLSSSACLVGGSVRDAIISKDSKDFDFVTDTPYDVLTITFLKYGFDVKETGKAFLVMNVIKDGVNIEIANFRKDGTYSDGRRPESVDIGTLDDDANRRDFTINALYFNLTSEQILDPTGLGLADINNNVLRFIGKPIDRLNEDFLRGWRFLRFLKKGFEPDKKSYKAVKSNWDTIYKLSNPQRVLDEVNKML